LNGPVAAGWRQRREGHLRLRRLLRRRTGSEIFLELRTERPLRLDVHDLVTQPRARPRDDPEVASTHARSEHRHRHAAEQAACADAPGAPYQLTNRVDGALPAEPGGERTRTLTRPPVTPPQNARQDPFDDAWRKVQYVIVG